MVQSAGHLGNTPVPRLGPQPDDPQRFTADHARSECYPALNQARCRHLSPMFWRNLQVGDAAAAVGSAIAALQVPTDPPPRHRWVRITAGVQNHLLHVGEDRFHRIVVGIAFGQVRPANPQGAQLSACARALDRMGRLAIQGQPQLPLTVTAADLKAAALSAPLVFAQTSKSTEFSPSGHWLVVMGEKPEEPPHLWNLTGDRPLEHSLPGASGAAAWIPGKNKLSTGGTESNVLLLGFG